MTIFVECTACGWFPPKGGTFRAGQRCPKCGTILQRTPDVEELYDIEVEIEMDIVQEEPRQTGIITLVPEEGE